MQLISCALTEPQIHARTKTQTRRLGWKKLKPKKLLCIVNKCMGLKPGEKQRRLAVIFVTAVRREKLYRIPEGDPAKEGFPEMTPRDFTLMFSRAMNCDPREEVTVIDFLFVPGGRG